MHQTTGICPDYDSIEVSIGEYIPVVFQLPNTILCDTAVEINLEALPLGGVFSGNGIDGNTFFPSLSGIGTHQINYSYNNEGCISSESQEITVENCSSLQELNHAIKIWPNPFQEKIESILC